MMSYSKKQLNETRFFLLSRQNELLKLITVMYYLDLLTLEVLINQSKTSGLDDFECMGFNSNVHMYSPKILQCNIYFVQRPKC